MRSVPFSVWRLMVAYSMMMAGTSMMVLIAGIIGVGFAPAEGLVTLPVALLIVGVASSTLPTGKLFGRFGRRRVFIAYGLLAIVAALLAVISLRAWSFGGFCMAAFMMGWSGAATHQYRFSALEQVAPQQAAEATSVLLLGGILGAFIGPELAVLGSDLSQTPFAGSFFLLSVVYVLGTLLVSTNPDTRVDSGTDDDGGRPLKTVFRSPVVLLAVSSAALAYAVMSFLMTATPISMHEHAGHDLVDTKRVIQAHIIAMYLPSLAFAGLLARWGYRRVLLAGVLAFVLCLVSALAGTGVSNYWLAMVLLGIGWNFLFLGGTNLLVFGYRPKERFRVQAANDFMVFAVQAGAALSAGWVLHMIGWGGQLLLIVPLIVLFTVLVVRSSAYSRIQASATTIPAEKAFPDESLAD
jgi:MFS family permease